MPGRPLSLPRLKPYVPPDSRPKKTRRPRGSLGPVKDPPKEPGEVIHPIDADEPITEERPNWCGGVWHPFPERKPEKYELVEIRDARGNSRIAWWTGKSWDCYRERPMGEVTSWIYRREHGNYV